jgi:hypothetical protein
LLDQQQRHPGRQQTENEQRDEIDGGDGRSSPGRINASAAQARGDDNEIGAGGKREDVMREE